MSDSKLSSAAISEIDPQTRACMRMWANVVSLAIRDACGKPFKSKGGTITPSDVSKSAIRFLFDPHSHIAKVLDCFDINVDGFRRNLIDLMYNNKSFSEFNARVQDTQKRNFRLNYLWYAKSLN